MNKSSRTIFIHAPNVHQGGGAVLLTALIKSTSIETRFVLVLDSRFNIEQFVIGDNFIIKLVNPSIYERLLAEVWLSKQVKKTDKVLCFGNLPPLLKVSGKVFVYLQNRYLCTNASLKEFPAKVKLRILFERIWLKLFLRTSKIIVQGITMKRNVDSFLGINSLIMPFLNPHERTHTEFKTCYQYDYLYVASGEPHKNHLKLLNAWIVLSEQGLYPSLRLTLDLDNNTSLSRAILAKISHYKINVTSEVFPPEAILKLYSQSKALIYPSLFESFGLPLIEARESGLTVIASERDYVRDVIVPDFTFDPESELSIARAVMRHMGKESLPPAFDDAETFIKKLIDIS